MPPHGLLDAAKTSTTFQLRDSRLKWHYIRIGSKAADCTANRPPAPAHTFRIRRVKSTALSSAGSAGGKQLSQVAFKPEDRNIHWRPAGCASGARRISEYPADQADELLANGSACGRIADFAG
jgi:hypothetical protein